MWGLLWGIKWRTYLAQHIHYPMPQITSQSGLWQRVSYPHFYKGSVMLEEERTEWGAMKKKESGITICRF